MRDVLYEVFFLEVLEASEVLAILETFVATPVHM